MAKVKKKSAFPGAKGESIFSNNKKDSPFLKQASTNKSNKKMARGNHRGG